MRLALHSSESNEHYTPLPIIEAARRVMGGIDLDPATSHSVNKHRVKAARCFTKRDNGLQKVWRGKVWLNPPGGLIGRQSAAAVWWEKLVDDWLDGTVEQAVFLGFSVEIFAQSQDAREWVGGVPFCVPRKRLRYSREVSPGDFEVEEEPEFEEGKSPTHADVIAYLPPNKFGTPLYAGQERIWTASPYCGDWVHRFRKEFQEWGKIRA